MLMGELLTAAGLDIPVKLMVFNNSTLGHGPRRDDGRRLPALRAPTCKNPDFGALATAAGSTASGSSRPPTSGRRSSARSTHPGPALIDFVTDPRALAMPPKATLEEVKGFALTTSKLVFSGDFAEVWAQVKSNIRDVRQAL